MTSGPDIGRYDPFEDTGDWPFRDAPPREEDEPVAVEPPATDGLDVSPSSGLAADTALSPPPEADEEAYEALAEPDPEPAVDAEIEIEEAEAPEELPAAGVLVGNDELAPADDEPPPAEEISEPVAGAEHAPGELLIPPGADVLAGAPHGFRRQVAVVVSRFNGDITTGLLASALETLRECNVADDAVTVVPVPGAFELPLAALALAKTRRFSCVVALGCVIRGDTPHFDLVAGEAASGLQLAGIETGIPVSFGVLACETREQAEERVDRGAEAARTALEMADLFSHVRTRAAAT